MANKHTDQVLATNRKAFHNYEILDSIECGIVLRGSEVKSLRSGNVQIAEAFARITNNEVWLQGMTVAAYDHSGRFDSHQPDRLRKLLLHRHEIQRLKHRLELDQLTLVVVKLILKNGKVKVLLGVARGKKQHDKRQMIAERDAKREVRKAVTIY